MLLIALFVFIAPDGIPLLLTLNEANPTSLWLQWSPPALEHQNGVIKGYQVSWELSGESSHKDILVGIKNVTLLSIIIENLWTSTSYKVLVAAYNTVGVGPSANITVNTTDSK